MSSNNKFIIKINPSELVPKSSARVYYFIAFWLTVLQAGTIALMWKYIPNVVPIFFTRPWGEARLAPKLSLFMIPAFSIVAIILNMILGKIAKVESPVLSYVLAVGALMVTTMFAIGLAGIMQSIL